MLPSLERVWMWLIRENKTVGPRLSAVDRAQPSCFMLCYYMTSGALLHTQVIVEDTELLPRVLERESVNDLEKVRGVGSYLRKSLDCLDR